MKQLPLAFLVLLVACAKSFSPTAVQYNQQPIGQNAQIDSSLYRLLIPYRDSVNNAMNGVLATIQQPLYKAQPDGSLNRFMADAVLYGARKTFGPDVAAAFINYGGVRLTDVPAGPLTRGKIFEMMPFDNVLVTQQVSGTVLQEFLNILATRGGWPVAGLTFSINNGKATNVMVDNKPLDLQKTYIIAQSDYVINGGDGINMLKNIPQQNKGYLLRDALLDYASYFTKAGQPVSVSTQNRISK